MMTIYLLVTVLSFFLYNHIVCDCLHPKTSTILHYSTKQFQFYIHKKFSPLKIMNLSKKYVGKTYTGHHITPTSSQETKKTHFIYFGLIQHCRIRHSRNNTSKKYDIIGTRQPKHTQTSIHLFQ